MLLTELNFGTFALSTSSQLQPTVLNETGAPVNITSIASSDQQFINLTPLPVAIEDTESEVITVQFLPTSTGPFSATLTISYNPDVVISLTGCGGSCDSDSGGGEDGDERAPSAVPFGGEVYLLMLVVGYGIYALSRRRH